MLNADEIRPAGIKRKIIISEPRVLTSGSGVPSILGYFPNGAHIISMHQVNFGLQSANASSTTLNVGLADAGDTIIDGFPLTNDGAIGAAYNMKDTPGTNGGIIDVPVGGTVFWEHSTDDVDGGKVTVEMEYEDIK